MISPRVTAMRLGQVMMLVRISRSLAFPEAITYPWVHRSRLNMVRKALAYRMPSSPKSARIRGNPI